MILTLQFVKQFSMYAGAMIVTGAILFALLRLASTLSTGSK